MCFVFTDRHKSFKLRLPSIRRDIRRSSRLEDVEQAGENEESVPLHQLALSHGSHGSPVQEKRLLEREISDFSTFSYDDHQKSSQGSLRKASSLEHLDHSRSPRGRLKSSNSGINHNP